MRKTLTFAIAALVSIATAIPATAADHPQKPGKWQTKFQMEMPGVPFKMPPVTVDTCVSEEDLKDPQKSVPMDPKSKCTISDHKITDSTVSWTMDCPEQNMKGTGALTYSEAAYTGEMNMTVGEQKLVTKFTGKWLGACTR